jgi:pseudouridine 5'-phosphatase
MTHLASPTITAVVFDMDGLLLDTEGIYTEATQRIAGRYGKVFDWAVKRDTIGLGAMASARQVVDAMALPMTAAEFLQERDALLRSRFPAARAMPGARELVEHLARHHVPMAVATSSGRELFGIKTQRHQDWFRHFGAIVTADDPEVGAAKPAPDLFRVAAQRIHADPARTLAFEDSPFGVQAAVAAGMRVIAVPDPEMDRGRYALAADILDSLLDFQPAHWGLPPQTTGTGV